MEAERGRNALARRPRRLILALTNRRDLLDPALLRPGRFEVQIEVPLPGEAGRLAIFRILTSRIRESGALESAADADLGVLARASVGLSGADLAGVVRSAKAAALRRALESPDASAAEGASAVLRGDLRSALREELRRRESRGEPGTPVVVFDAEAAAADMGAGAE